MDPFDSRALAATPWKNGGGTTRTLAVSPPDAGFDSFIWRVSIADVGASGGFSSFPGIDRQILLLEGAGMVLEGEGTTQRSLTEPYIPLSLSGEEPVYARLVNGSSRDFNVMTRRERAIGSLHVWESSHAIRWNGDAVLYCARGEFEISTGGDGAQLPAGWACGFSVADATLRVAPKVPNAVLIGALFEIV